jgi:hypothetical protein
VSCAVSAYRDAPGRSKHAKIASFGFIQPPVSLSE